MNSDSGSLDDLGFHLNDNKKCFIKLPSDGLCQYSRHIKRVFIYLFILEKEAIWKKNCGDRIKTQFGLQFQKVGKKEALK